MRNPPLQSCRLKLEHRGDPLRPELLLLDRPRKRRYLSDFAEMLAPAEKKRLSAEIEISRGGATRFKNIGDNSPQTRRHSRLAREISNRWFKSVTAARLHLSTPSSLARNGRVR